MLILNLRIMLYIQWRSSRFRSQLVSYSLYWLLTTLLVIHAHDVDSLNYSVADNFDPNLDYVSGKPVSWSPESGFKQKTPGRFDFPRSALGIFKFFFLKLFCKNIFSISHRKDAGQHLGLSLILNVDYWEYFCSSTNSYGFKLLLHSPIESPNIR